MKATIKLTDRMLNKHQINANEKFKTFALEKLGVDYSTMQKGEAGKVTKPAALLISQSGFKVWTEVRMYRQNNRGDCLLSIKGLKSIAKGRDILALDLDKCCIQIKLTRSSGGMTYKQAEERLNYLNRRMSLSNSIEAQDYWWKQIQALGSEVVA